MSSLLPNPVSLLSQTGFWEHRSWSLSQCPPLTDKVAVITGGNGGIGSEIVLHLLKYDTAKVVVLARNKTKFDTVKKEKWIPGLGGDAAKVEERVEFVSIDLTDLRSVKETAEHLFRNLHRLDLLFLHAGLSLERNYELSPQGVDKTFAANHLGHFALTIILLPRILSTPEKFAQTAPSCRIVGTSSSLHTLCRSIDFSALTAPKQGNLIRQYEAMYRYARSKLANILFIRELSRRLKGMEGGGKVYANVFFPGNIATDTMDSWKDQFGSFVGGIIKKSFGAIGQSLEDGATTAIYLAAAKEVEDKDIRGSYFVPVAYLEKPSDVAQDEALAEELWTWSEKIFADA